MPGPIMMDMVYECQNESVMPVENAPKSIAVEFFSTSIGE